MDRNEVNQSPEKEGKIMMIAFVIWTVVVCIFVGIGVRSWSAESPVGFWTNAKPPVLRPEVVKAYNKSVAKIWFVFAIIFEICGLPILFIEQNSPFFIVIIVGVMLDIIGIMVAYTKVEKKYKTV